MKTESQKRHEHILFLATENVILHVNQPYKIRHDMIESKNFIPEAFLIHQFQDSKHLAIHSLTARLGEGNDRSLFPDPANLYDPFPAGSRGEITSYFSDEDDEDEDWDDEDEEWDEDEDEDWDEEDEEWDDDEEEWDDEDEDIDGEEDWSDDEEE